MSDLLNSQLLNSKLIKTVLLVGAPNSGKTTLYNWLTGSKFKTVNYPGATVEYSVGGIRPQLVKMAENQQLADQFQIIDTPGIYSVNPQSEDERITLSLLKSELMPYQKVILVIDATQIKRQFILAQQLIGSGCNVTVVLTMNDLLKKHKKNIQIKPIEKYLKQLTNQNVEILLFDGLFAEGLTQIVEDILKTTGQVCHLNNQLVDNNKTTDELKKISEFIDAEVLTEDDQRNQVLEQTLKIDRYLLHPFFGYVFFMTMMTFLFASIYWMSAPFMDFIDGQMSALASLTKNNISGLFGEFLADGVITAISGVIIFIPQIFILFFGIGAFESTGYLARVAALADGPFRKIGLGGRSFVPLLSGFACAIPALMATRNITSKKERLIAQMIIPFMSCSARIPVYGLMIGFLFSDKSPFLAGFAMAALYLTSIAVGILASAALSKILFSGSYGSEKSTLAMDLPLYRRPRLQNIITQSIEKSKSFVKKAGPIIAVLAVVLWVATTFPKSDIEGDIKTTYAMQVANAIEPVFKPMGLDGRVGFALLASFAAREVFVSSLALSLQAGEVDDDNQTPLLEKMAQITFDDGTKIFTLASVLGVLIFFVIATQCLSTVGVLKKESGGWKWALIQLIGSNVIAYTLAVFVVQVVQSLS